MGRTVLNAMNNHTKQFIEDAVEAGYNIDKDWFLSLPQWEQRAVFTEPEAWQAVGKTREWKDTKEGLQVIYRYRVNMHRFLDHLIAEKSIEQALEEISK